MIVIVDYGAGNLTSVRLAFESLRVPARIAEQPPEVLDAERVVFPGVGAAGAAMRSLAALRLVEPLRAVAARGTPLLGICLGAQIVFERSEEDGGVATLGIVPGRVQRFRPADPATKVPHMGWNGVRQLRPHPLFEGIEDESEFYFVHSYYPAPADAACAIGETDYAEVRFASAVGARNVVATQFHPEKSGRIGLRLLRNFTEWDGAC